MQKLILSALGEYGGILASSFITATWGKSSNASPDLCHINGKLSIFLNEPNPKEYIQTGTLKLLTSGCDRLSSRGLYETEMRTFTNKSKFTLVVNNPLYIPGLDIPTIKRTCVIPWTTTFVDRDEYDRENLQNRKNMHLADPTLEKTIGERYKIAMMYLMIHELQKLKTNGIFERCREIERTTKLVFMATNLGFRFCEECFEPTEGELIDTKDVYEQFRGYYHSLRPDSKAPDLGQFIRDVQNSTNYKIDYNLLHGVRLRPNEVRSCIETNLNEMEFSPI